MQLLGRTETDLGTYSLVFWTILKVLLVTVVAVIYFQTADDWRGTESATAPLLTFLSATALCVSLLPTGAHWVAQYTQLVAWAVIVGGSANAARIWFEHEGGDPLYGLVLTLIAGMSAGVALTLHVRRAMRTGERQEDR